MRRGADREAAPLPPSRFSFHLCAHRAGALPSSVLLICPKVLHTFLICSPSPWRSGAASILPSPRANSARGRSIHRGKVMKRGPGICKVRKGIWEEKPLQIKAFKLEYKLKSSSILFANLEGDYSIRVRTRHTPGIWVFMRVHVCSRLCRFRCGWVPHLFWYKQAKCEVYNCMQLQSLQSCVGKQEHFLMSVVSIPECFHNWSMLPDFR